MSLRVVHIVFILSSIAVAFGFAAWCASEFRLSGGSGLVWMGGVSAAAGIGLAAYLPAFLKKTKDLHS